MLKRRIMNLQLAICMGHLCRSMGYSFRFMGQDRVKDTLHKDSNYWIIRYKLWSTENPAFLGYIFFITMFYVYNVSTLDIRSCEKLWQLNFFHQKKYVLAKSLLRQNRMVQTFSQQVQKRSIEVKNNIAQLLEKLRK